MLEIGVQEALALSVEYSHLNGGLILPERVSEPLSPLHMAAEVTVPPAAPGVIVTSVVVVAEHPLLSVTVAAYVPEAAIVTLLIDGLWLDDAKLFGPVQL